MTESISSIEKDAEFNFIEITTLTKVEKSILNAAGSGGGNVTELKKTTEIDNTERIFVSGTSVKWSIKKFWEENWPGSTSPIVEKKAGAQISSQCKPDKFIDDDLFGYFNTGTNLARTAPVKTSGMISIFDVDTNIDNRVRYSKKDNNHSMFEQEISTNVFRSSWVIEVDRIGETIGKPESEKVIHIPPNEKEKRLKMFFHAIFDLWQRTQQTNNLTNTQPNVMVIIFRQGKSPVIGDRLRIDNQKNLDLDALKEALSYHEQAITLAYVAADKSFLNNFDDFLKLDIRNGFASDLVTLKNKILSPEFKLFR